jgi:hypothetical protein
MPLAAIEPTWKKPVSKRLENPPPGLYLLRRRRRSYAITDFFDIMNSKILG